MLDKQVEKLIELKQERKIRSWKIQEINALFQLGEHELVLEKINELTKRNKDPKKGEVDSMLLIQHKIAYIKGNSQPLLNWIDLYSSHKAQLDPNELNQIQDLNIFMLEHDNPLSDKPISVDSANNLISAYRDAIEVEHQLGHQSDVARKLIKIAHIHINQNNHVAFNEVLDEIHFFELNWWQIDLLEAYKFHYLSNTEQAIQLANRAKQNSTDSWNQSDDALFQLIVDETT